MKTGAELVAEERARQVRDENWTPEHDDEHTLGQLAKVAAALAAEGTDAEVTEPSGWVDGDPWGLVKRHCDPVRRLVIAGALIAAEIDRIQRHRAALQRLREEQVTDEIERRLDGARRMDGQVSRTDHFIGLRDSVYAAIRGSDARSEEIATLEGAFGSDFPLSKYVFDDGTELFEYVQAQPWASGPHFFIALKDANGEPVSWSLWTEDEIEGYL